VDKKQGRTFPQSSAWVWPDERLAYGQHGQGILRIFTAFIDSDKTDKFVCVI